jgi:hypothetical protein
MVGIMPQVRNGRERVAAMKRLELRSGRTTGRLGSRAGVAAQYSGARRPQCGVAGLVAMVIFRGVVVLGLPRKAFTRSGLQASAARIASRNCMLRVRRRQRRSDGLRWLRRAEAAGPTKPAMETSRRPAAWTTMPARMDHGVVMAVVMVPVALVAGDAEAGEENRRHNEQDPGHDHNPRSEPIEPIRLNRCSWRGGDRCRPGWGFWCFTHT